MTETMDPSDFNIVKNLGLMDKGLGSISRKRSLSHSGERFVGWGDGDPHQGIFLKLTQMAPPMGTLDRLVWGELGETLMAMLFSCSLSTKECIPIM